MEHIPLPEPSVRVTVAEFFREKSVFVTGATGYMGKVLVEKLLWSCEDIEAIYVLVRPKKSVDPQKRIDQMLELPVFERLKNRDPSIFKKLIPIAGDVAEINLGISDEDRKLLESKVSIVFHAASSVRFDDPLKKSIMINVRGTRDVMKLACNMKQLKVFMYISTSYCNSVKKVIEEEVVPSDYDWSTLIKLAETTDDHILNILEPKILDQRPNTYTFTKSIAENLVHEYSSMLPIIIIRPSIVSFCIHEPTPGWVDNLNGPIGMSYGIALGVIHVLYGNPNCITDYIPCDYATNGIILAACYRGTSDSKECIVMNGAAGTKKIVSSKNVLTLSSFVLEEMPPRLMLWYPSTIMTSNKYVFMVLFLFLHIIPGIFVDLVLKVHGTKFRLMKIYRKIFIANLALKYFLTSDWKIITTKYDWMVKYVHPDDAKTFPYDPDHLDILYILTQGGMGLKKYIYKEETNEKDLELDRKNYQLMKTVHEIMKMVCMVAGSMMMINYSRYHLLPWLYEYLSTTGV